jgi:hypothetical protein
MRLLASLLAVALAAACAPEGGAAGACKGAFLPGDLVISEVFADPAGDDAGKEWWEIYNAGAGADLEGLVLIASKNDRTGERRHVMGKVAIGAGDYFVVGGMANDLRPPHVAYGYGNALSTLRNSDGRLALRCGDVLVDEMTYKATKANTGLAFSGALVPDAVANDDEAMWCDAKAEYDAGAKGTPGAANEACTPVGSPTECLDGGTRRPIVRPQPGDLVISEWMPDPAAVGDTAGEWIEVAVRRDVDLNGLELGKTPPTVITRVNDAACLRRTAGSHVLFARNAMASMNGMLPPVDFTTTINLTNSGDSIFIGIGGQLLDQVTYTGSRPGVSRSVDPAHLTPEGNDDARNVCDGTTVFGAGDRGTPGAPNPSCGTVLPEDMCSDGGTMRAILPPQPGDLVITEWMADPAAVADASGEWFEVAVLRDVDLNGLQLGKTPPTVSTTVTSASCLRRTAGSFVLFARSAISADNGMLPPVDFTFSFGLTNSGDAIFIGRGGEVLDRITYTNARPGISMALDPAHTTPAGNDDAANICLGTTVFGAGDRGSPGSANPPCP